MSTFLSKIQIGRTGIISSLLARLINGFIEVFITDNTGNSLKNAILSHNLVSLSINNICEYRQDIEMYNIGDIRRLSSVNGFTTETITGFDVHNDPIWIPLLTGVQKYSATIGDDINIQFDVEHNFSRSVMVQVYSNSSGIVVYPVILMVTIDMVQIQFPINDFATPLLNEYTVIIIG